MQYTYDPQKAARVWKRVQERSEAETREQTRPEGSVRNMILEAMTAAAVYLQLAHRLSGPESAVLQRLYREEQNQAACLKGIHTLITGEAPAVSVAPVPQENPELTLRRCYAREMQCLKNYEARIQDPDYGPVFHRMAVQEREHCKAVLELLGNLKRKERK